MMGVDFPDGHKLSVIRGWDGTEFKNIKVAETGELYILLSALYNSNILPLKCDDEGNAFLNVKAQDLAEVINRPKYGAVQLLSGTTNCAYQYTTLFSISGKGVVYSGRFSLTGVAETHLEDFLRLTVDGNQIISPELQYLNLYNLVKPYDDIFYITYYDNTGYNYSVCITPLITFEASLLIEWYNRQLTARNVDYSFAYALV